MTTNQKALLLERYKKGERNFSDLEIEDADFRGVDLQGAVFENCLLAVDFRGANLSHTVFINGNIKTCDFSNADLTNARFENLSIEGTRFKGAITTGFVFKNNHAYSKTGIGQADFEAWLRDLWIGD